MTGTLTITYRQPTPLHTDVTFEGKLREVVGRKVFVDGTLKAGDALTAEAEGIFVSINFEKFRTLIEERDQPAAT
jgi:predicted thioesterase